MHPIWWQSRRFSQIQAWLANYTPTQVDLVAPQASVADSIKFTRQKLSSESAASTRFVHLLFSLMSHQIGDNLSLHSFKKMQRSKLSLFWYATVLFIFFLFFVATLGSSVDARVYVVQPRSAMAPRSRCRVQQNSELHVLMDRICLLCHEMFSHERPNMRAECRSNCFRTEHFRKCLAVFTPGRQAAKLLLEF